jgi:anti-sigma B factor antagonist
MRLTPSAEAVPRALEAIDGLAGRLSREELEEVRLLVAELVTNSVLHAGLGPGDGIRARVVVSPRLVWGEVVDPGPRTQAPGGEPVGDRTSGHGLRVLERVAERSGVEMGDGGGQTRAWFELRRPRGASAGEAYRDVSTELRGTLSASVGEEAGAVVVAARGEVHLNTREALHGALEDAVGRVGESPGTVVLDLSEVGFFDSIGVGLLVGSTERLRERGGEVHVVAPEGPCLRVLRVTGLDKVFRIHRDLQSALREVARRD